MDFLYTLFVFLHIVGAAALVGGWLATFRKPTVLQWQHIGAWVQLVTGLLLVGLAEMGDGTVNHMKIGIKLVILIGVLVAAVIGRRKVARDEPVAKGLAHAVGGLSLINIAIAVFW
ncbi:hypothetical protein EAH68_08790 [Corynebacterium hylobatis]|uniref:Integral membrane protein n=1 Tax=Corynebacterium hylobatis TaxID=1859290 RepID=A0A430HXD4_9CORY|nr:hypothetical protein [Corynebacterium hylobatis]RSZ62870.1 hypothetical protein EAH68_08790 [Corynebacterium hylobatis]